MFRRYDESGPDTPESMCFPEEIARLFTGSNTNAKTEVSAPQTLSSSSGYSSANSNSIQCSTMNCPSTNASSSIQSAAYDYPLTNYHNLDTLCGSVDTTATMQANYELYYQPYWTNSYNDPTSISANVRSDTTSTATMFTEPTSIGYSLPSFSSCFSNTNKTSGKGYEYTVSSCAVFLVSSFNVETKRLISLYSIQNSQQHWSSYYDATANAYPYAYNVPYSTQVQPSNNVANGLMDYTPSPEPNCIDLTKIDETGNNCATPLSVDDSSSASSLTIMDDAECDSNNVSEADLRNEKLPEDSYNHVRNALRWA